MHKSNELVRKIVVLQDDLSNIYIERNRNNSAGGTEITPMMVFRTSYTDHYPCTIQPEILFQRVAWSRVAANTMCIIANFAAILALQIFTVLYHDPNRVSTLQVIWTVFGFSIVIRLNKQNHQSVACVSEMAQIVLYIWFCGMLDNTTMLHFLLFFSLVAVIIASHVLRLCIKKLCINAILFILNCHIRKKQRFVLRSHSILNCKLDGIIIFFSTIPMLYFDENEVWHEYWFTVLVVCMLSYQQMIYLMALIRKDWYTLRFLKELNAHSPTLSFNRMYAREVFECEVARWMDNDWTINKIFHQLNDYSSHYMIIPALYDIMVLALIIHDLSTKTKDNFTTFEYAYSISLCICLGVTVCTVCLVWCSKQILHSLY